MKYLVTGGAGFIGSHLVEKLVKLGKEVIVIDNLSTGRLQNIKSFKKKIEFHKLDINETSRIIKISKKCKGIFHLAALADIVPSIINPDEYYRTNVNGTLSILNVAKENKIKNFVYTASSSCYGIPKKYPTNENSAIDCKYPYALTKYLGECLVMHWSKLYGLNANSLRLFNVYGTRSRTSGAYGAVFGVFLAQKLANMPLTIVGNGEQTRDFTYVTDVVEGILEVFFKKEISNEIFNIGSGKTISINQIAKLLEHKKVFIPKRPGEPDCTFADIKKIKKYSNWSPKVNINDGVSKILSNIDYWKTAPVWTPKSIKSTTKNWFKFIK